MIKQIIREGEEKGKEETQDCQRSIPSILDPSHSGQPADFIKIRSPLCHTNRISSLLFLSQYSFFFFLPGKQTLFACLSHKCDSIKTFFVIC